MGWSQCDDRGGQTKRDLKSTLIKSEKSVIMLISGMGQGMFFFFAALLVCAKIMMTMTYTHMVLDKVRVMEGNGPVEL
eukprot:5728354-Pyramimonas_sp.AAC.1